MKKVLAVAVLISAVSASTAFALNFGTNTNVPKAGVVASKHNMNLYLETVKDGEGRVCAFCHTPHHAVTSADADYTPLWSHDIITTAATYVPYFSATLTGAITAPLTGPSILCMSCHDGAIAVDQHYGSVTAVGSTAKLTDDIFNGTAIGKGQDVSNDHPVGFMYSDAKTADSGIKDASGVFLGTTRTIASQLTGGLMTCATCHDVHNKDNAAQKGASNYFLMASQDGSALCLSCHDK
jgi:hypothetical protein